MIFLAGKFVYLNKKRYLCGKILGVYTTNITKNTISWQLTSQV